MEIPEESNNPAGIIEHVTVKIHVVLPETVPLDDFISSDAQQTSQHNSYQTVEVKKESLDQVIKTIKEVSEKTVSTIFPVFNAQTFEKIKNSNANKEKVKTQTKTQDLNKPVKPDGMSQNAWKKSLKGLRLKGLNKQRMLK